MGISLDLLEFNQEINPFYQNTLRAEKINIFHYPEAKRIASIWATVAREKEKLATTLSEKEQFSSCAGISEAMASSLSWPQFYQDIYVCKDSYGNFQGMMKIAMNTDEVYIALLVTNPINIRSPVNAEEWKKVSGAGTTLLHKAEELAIQKDKTSLRLHPLESAVEFYKKNGFVFDGWSMRKVIQQPKEDFIWEFSGLIA